MTTPPPEFPLPAVHAALDPYLRPAPSTLHLRQQLSHHLRSLAQQPRVTSASGSSDEFTRFLDLELSRTPGSRRDYLSAIRANAAAKREYDAAIAAVTYDDEGEESTEDEDQDDQAAKPRWREDYMAALRLRRQLQRLSVAREFLSVLSSTAPGENEEPSLSSAYPHPPPAAPPELTVARPDENEDIGGPGKTSTIQSVTLELEKAVVHAHEEFFHEQSLLAKAGGGSESKKSAMIATREVLIDYVNSTLDSVPAPPSPNGNGDTEKPPPQTLESVLSDINTAYDDYLASRQRLLETFAATTASKAVDEKPVEEAQEMLQSRLDCTPPAPAPGIVRALAGVESLLPLVRSQKALLSTQNYLINSITSRRKKTMEMDEVEKLIGEAEVKVGDAQKRAKGDVVTAKEKLEEARKVLVEVQEMVITEKRPDGSRIPVGRGGKRKGGSMPEEEVNGGLWAGLGGKVGVIGDGI